MCVHVSVHTCVRISVRGIMLEAEDRESDTVCGSTNRKTALTADARTALPRNNSSPLWLRNALECVSTVVAAINCSVHARYHKNLWMDVIVVWCE